MSHHLEYAIRRILEDTLFVNGPELSLSWKRGQPVLPVIDVASQKIAELVGGRGRRRRLSPARLNMLRRLDRARDLNKQYAAGGLERMVCEALVDIGYAERGEQADRAGLMHYFAISELGAECIKTIKTTGYMMRE